MIQTRRRGEVLAFLIGNVENGLHVSEEHKQENALIVIIVSHQQRILIQCLYLVLVQEFQKLQELQKLALME